MTPFLTSITSLLGSSTAFLLAFYISSQGLKNKIRFSYALAAATAGLWLLIYSFWLWQDDMSTAFLYIRFVMLCAIFTYPTLLHFVLRFLDYKNKVVIVVAYLSALFLGYFCLFTEYFVSGVTQKLLYPYWGIRGGFIFDIYVLIWIIVIAFSLSLILGQLKRAKSSMKKAQLRFILLGLSFGYIGGASNFFLWYDIPIPPYGNILIPFYFSLIAYAIVKYRFADIRMIIRRSAVFAVLVAIITSVYALLAYLISVFFQGFIGTQSIVLNGVITAVLVSIGFEPLKKYLSKATDKYLFQAEYNVQEVLAEFSDKLSSTIDLSYLSSFLVKRLSQIFKCQFVSLYLLDEKSDEYVRKSSVGKVVRKINRIDKKLFNSIFGYLKKSRREKEIFVREEIKKLNEESHNDILELFYEELERSQVNLVVPLYIQDKLIGIIFLGDKKSGDVFSLEDLRVMEIISKQAGVSIQNSLLFEEQRKFAQKLKKEVDKATKELKDANVKLKKLDKAKSEFISIASHQLRTPLTVIKGYISMINQGDYGNVPTKIADPLVKVFHNTMRIITLVEDLLNISRIESGRLVYNFEKVNMPDLVQEVYTELENHGKVKGLKFAFEKPKEKLPEILVDRKKIREVIMNLMDNAIKYTPKGHVTVHLEKEGSNIIYSVSDSGRGLEPEDISQLFQKFSRASGAQLLHTEGTGLGLYIAKKIIQKHNGEVWAESDGRDKGSTFAIKFRIKNPKLEKEIAKTVKSKKS